MLLFSTKQAFIFRKKEGLYPFLSNKWAGGDIMSFRYGMRDKSPQAQAIVRQRDKEDELLKQSQKEKTEIECKPSPRKADYEGVFFLKDDRIILELRVSGLAITNGPCNLKNINIHEWLCRTGRSFVSDVKEFEIIQIDSVDVLDQKLVSDWRSLKRVKE